MASGGQRQISGHWIIMFPDKRRRIAAIRHVTQPAADELSVGNGSNAEWNCQLDAERRSVPGVVVGGEPVTGAVRFGQSVELTVAKRNTQVVRIVDIGRSDLLWRPGIGHRDGERRPFLQERLWKLNPQFTFFAAERGRQVIDN